MLFGCHVGRRISDVQRNAALGKPSSAIEQRWPETGRSVAGCAAVATCTDVTGPGARSGSLRNCGSEGRQCEGSSGFPTRRRSRGAAPATQSSLSVDQAGCVGRSGNSRRYRCSFVPAKSGASTRCPVRCSPMKPGVLQPDNGQPVAARPFLISFSGIDGAGKTTQIEYLTSYLQNQGQRVLLLTFWDNVAVWSKMRGGVGQRTMDSLHTDQATQVSFVPKNNKHIRKWYLSAARAGFYTLDVARLRRLLASPHVKEYDVVIFDRYIYDQIANIYSKSSLARIYAKILLQQTPVPNLAFIIDASPAAAFARKPEFPLEFVNENQRSFLHLRELVPQLIVIAPGQPEDMRNEICTHLRHSRVLNPASSTGDT